MESYTGDTDAEIDTLRFRQLDGLSLPACAQHAVAKISAIPPTASLPTMTMQDCFFRKAIGGLVGGLVTMMLLRD
jgi:hypothetical protein